MENSPKSGESLGFPPAFDLNDFSLHLPVVLSTSPQISSSVSRFSGPLKRNGRLVRPSTASAAEEKSTLLPLAPNIAIVDVATSESKAGREPTVYRGSSFGTQDDGMKSTSAKGIFSERSSKASLGEYSS
jgi:hypothetical protein